MRNLYNKIILMFLHIYYDIDVLDQVFYKYKYKYFYAWIYTHEKCND